MAIGAGKRIKNLREILGLSCQDFCGLDKRLKFSTLSKLESNHLNLSLKIAKIICEIVELKGFGCSLQWLIHGKGPEPYSLSGPSPSFVKSSIQETYKNIKVIQDILHFRNTYPEGEVSLIVDDAMIPFFRPGDYVGVVHISINQLDENHPGYLVKLKSGNQMVRGIIKEGPLCFRLIASNRHYPESFKVVAIADIEIIAPVIWHRLGFQGGMV